MIFNFNFIAGSVDQLLNTERSNGIVQDEPEVIVECMEKIDVLFNRIKTSTFDGAEVYGQVLCHLIRDLVPPKELMTKAMKELLTISQPHCSVIAKVMFQVFRSAIDSSYLSLLQDWLICSMPNFFGFSMKKTIWCLTILFISSSINLQLIKLFPEILIRFGDFQTDQIIQNDNETDNIRRIQLFCLSSKDFYCRLNADQQNVFRNIFSNVDSHEIQFMLQTL